MNALIKSTTLIVLFSTEFIGVKSQDLKKFALGLSASTFIYQGDLTPARLGSYRTAKPGLQFYFTRILDPIFSLRTNIAFGTLKGDDSKYTSPAYRQQRNFKFHAPLIEISELVVADLLKNNFALRAAQLSPYVFAGAGLSFLKVHRDWSRFNAEYFSTETSTLQGLASDAQHSLPKTIPVVPLGIGIRYFLSKKISFTAETSFRLTFTDYVDGFSKAADPGQRDSYQTHSIGLVYRFQKNNTWWKCPVPKY